MSSEATDRSQQMEERPWWDLWNTSYRSVDNRDATSTELFAHVEGVIRSLAQQQLPSILEVACGTGTLSRQLIFVNYVGFDISPAAIEIAKQKLLDIPEEKRSAARYVAADFHDCALPSDLFDIALCVDAIACVRDQRVIMQRMAQSLRKGGVCLITTVNPFVYKRIRRAGGVRLENGPVSRYLTKEELHTLVRESGLEIERSYTIMPRGNMGFLRIVNSYRLNQAFGPRCAMAFKKAKEWANIGQYRVVVARKR